MSSNCMVCAKDTGVIPGLDDLGVAHINCWNQMISYHLPPWEQPSVVSEDEVCRVVAKEPPQFKIH